MQRKHLATESQMFDSSFFKNIFRDANNISASRFFGVGNIFYLGAQLKTVRARRYTI